VKDSPEQHVLVQTNEAGTMKRALTRAILLAVLVLPPAASHPCSWAIGFFYQVTSLRGIVVGMDRGWPRWIRQCVTRANV